MSEESTKPGADVPAFSAQDAMAFMQRMWNPFAMPMPGSASGAVVPTDVAGPASASAADTGTAGSGTLTMPTMFPFPHPAAMLAALDPAEVARKIGELRIVEGWLAMSLNLTQMSIRTLELQKTSLEALHAARSPAKGRAEKPRKR